MFFRRRPEEIRAGGYFKYIFTAAQKKIFSVRQMCTALSVSESGFYEWFRTRNRPKPWQNLLKLMYKILEEAEDNVNYGVERCRLYRNRKESKNPIQL